MNLMKLLSGVSLSGLALILCQGSVVAGDYKTASTDECYVPIQKVEYLLQQDTAEASLKTRGTQKALIQTLETDGTLEDAKAFQARMQVKYPQENKRLAAYGDYMAKEVVELDRVQIAVDKSQKCYDVAYLKLSDEYVSEILTERETKVKMRDIQKGAMASGDLLLKVANRVATNIKVYDLALKSETRELNLASATSKPELHEYITLVALSDYAKKSVSLPENASVEDVAAISPAAGGDDANAALNAGLQKVGISSGTYLDLHNNLMKRIEAQENLEEKISNTPW